MSVDVDLRTLGAQLLVAYLNRELLTPDIMGSKDVAAFVALVTGLNETAVPWLVPALLGLKKDARLEEPQINFKQVELRGISNEHFMFTFEGDVGARRYVLENCELRNVALDFKLQLDSQEKQGRFGKLDVQFR